MSGPSSGRTSISLFADLTALPEASSLTHENREEYVFLKIVIPRLLQYSLEFQLD